jgi:thioredoxin 1
MVDVITDQNFQKEVIESEMPVVVDFWAPWCGPCRRLAPVTEKLAEDYQGKVKFYKINVDENPNTSMKYQVMSIPTVLFFKGGQKIDTSTGAVPEGVLQPKIEALIGTK